MPELGLFSNPYLFGAVAVSGLLQFSAVALPFARPVFESVEHHAWEWVALLLLALTPVTLIEAAKLLWVRLTAGRPRPEG
jgi:Ca2+-transporting ATPase